MIFHKLRKWPPLCQELEKIVQSCTVLSDTLIVCQLPAFNLPNGYNNIKLVQASLHIELNLGRDSNSRNKSKSTLFSVSFNLPSFTASTETINFDPSKNEFLKIKGEDLTRGLSELDYEVSIGNGSCDITALTQNVLECQAPTIKPLKLLQNSQLCPNAEQLAVHVTVGGGENFYGCVRYQRGDSHQLIVGLTISLALLLVLLVTLVRCLLWRKRRKNMNKSEKVKEPQVLSSLPCHTTPENNEQETGSLNESIYSSVSLRSFCATNPFTPIESDNQKNKKLSSNLNSTPTVPQGLPRTNYEASLPQDEMLSGAGADSESIGYYENFESDDMETDLKTIVPFNSETKKFPYLNMSKATKRINYKSPELYKRY